MDWSALFKKESQLVKSFSSIIPSIFDMKLEWCKIFPLSSSGTFSGLVSENWLAVSRLCRWMYSQLPRLFSYGSIDLSHPDTDVFKWKGTELRKWLALRGLSRKGRVHELKGIIHEYLSNPETIPPIISRYTCPIGVVVESLISLSACVQRLMQITYTPSHINETENYIKLFLSLLHHWDSKSKDNNSKPIWLLSYSLLNLLNFPKMMRTYGPIRNLWEGGSRGEGILKLIKRNISSVNSNWHIAATKRFYQKKALDRLVDQLEDSIENEGLEFESFSDKANNFHLYGSLQNLNDAYHNGQPLSLIIDRNNQLYAIVNDNIIYKMNFGNFVQTTLGHEYFETTPPVLVNFGIEQLEIKSFGLLLPLLSDDDEEENTVFGVYTAITSDWTEIRSDKTFSLYSFPYDQNIDLNDNNNIENNHLSQDV